jgi:hypothetical protein
VSSCNGRCLCVSPASIISRCGLSVDLCFSGGATAGVGPGSDLDGAADA